MQQAGDLLFAELGQKCFSCPGGVHRQLAANGGRHAHQLGTLHLVDNNRLVIALVEHRQVDRLAGILHQLTQDRVHNGEQVTALQKAAADDKRVGTHGPVPQFAHLTHKAQLLHGGEQAMGGGVRQACLLGQLGQRHAAVRLGYPLQQFKAPRQRLDLSTRLGGCGGGFSAAFSGNGGDHDRLLFLYRGNHFRFIWAFCNRYPY